MTTTSNPCEQHKIGKELRLTQPCTRANAITYDYFCSLKGLEHPRTRKVEHRNGSHTYFTYHYLEY